MPQAEKPVSNIFGSQKFKKRVTEDSLFFDRKRFDSRVGLSYARDYNVENIIEYANKSVLTRLIAVSSVLEYRVRPNVTTDVQHIKLD